ncbi:MULTISPECIES: hypothetical protein [Rhizobiaceae]|uniref:SRPBCC family protein n=1 Tax=Aliirhizobium cellulosilyticum TaxID=393664 RepID=A0A7W6S872_9HYPH|nr:hypothetical protein [Rhizobium cellulosilyticum]MBB4348996.1 hypothetical protein [Rhizobium cellulosilyticum]MBB4412783.1 hypothetical protein [Rhizobium cellulosilyticum]MBB4447415.1 hypothetical protein [Rhizobium cellulosilyticum]
MKILADKILSQSAYSHDIDTPLDEVDIADWLFNLPEAEYQRCCPPDHIAAGATFTDDGRRMSINVEMIGTGLVVQHYVADEATPSYCRMNSISDVFTPLGERTQVNVIWELIAEAIDGNRTRYTNRVTCHPTDMFMDFIAKHGQTFEQAAAARQAAGGDHNHRETPLFAESIARKARARAAIRAAAE